VQIVLERRAREEERALAVEPADRLAHVRRLVLDEVALVEDDVPPPHGLAERRLHRRRLGHLERRDDDVVAPDVAELFLQALALGHVRGVELDDAERRRELGRLDEPRREDAQRRDDERRAAGRVAVLEVAQERERLERLP